MNSDDTRELIDQLFHPLCSSLFVDQLDLLFIVFIAIVDQMFNDVDFVVSSF